MGKLVAQLPITEPQYLEQSNELMRIMLKVPDEIEIEALVSISQEGFLFLSVIAMTVVPRDLFCEYLLLHCFSRSITGRHFAAIMSIFFVVHLFNKNKNASSCAWYKPVVNLRKDKMSFILGEASPSEDKSDIAFPH